MGSLVATLVVYDTSRLFIGSSPDRIPYEEQIDTETAYVEVIGRYERGLLRNRRVLWSNAFFFDASRFLLACVVVLFVLAAVFHVAVQSSRIQLLYQPLSVITAQF